MDGIKTLPAQTYFVVNDVCRRSPSKFQRRRRKGPLVKPVFKSKFVQEISKNWTNKVVLPTIIASLAPEDAASNRTKSMKTSIREPAAASDLE